MSPEPRTPDASAGLGPASSDSGPSDSGPLGLEPPTNGLDPAARREFFVAALIPVVVLTIVLGVAAGIALVVAAGIAGPLLVGAAAGVAAGGTVFAVVQSRIRYRMHRWEVGEHTVYSQSGWLTRTRVLVPINRIQVVDTHAGILDRTFGLASLTLSTASTAGTIYIHGLDAGLADRLAAELNLRADRGDSDAT